MHLEEFFSKSRAHLPSTVMTCPKWHDPPSPAPAPAARGVLVTYVFSYDRRPTNSLSALCPDLMISSFIASRSTTSELVVLYEHDAPYSSTDSTNGSQPLSSFAPCAEHRNIFGTGVRIERVPFALLNQMRRSGLEPFAYRVLCFAWYLAERASDAKYAGVLDSDLFFQLDVFEALFPWQPQAMPPPLAKTNTSGHRNGEALYDGSPRNFELPYGVHPLHFVTEDSLYHIPARLVGVQLSKRRKPRGIETHCDCGLVLTLMVLGLVPGPPRDGDSSCSQIVDDHAQGHSGLSQALANESLVDSSVSAQVLSQHPNARSCCARFQKAYMRVHPLNLGHVFGSRTAVIEMLKLTGRYMRGVAFNCWDQGIMTLLAWAGVYNASSATIWGPDEGFIKTIGFSVGGVRDARGRFLNENGLPYALVHQLKPARHIELTQQIRSALPPDLPPVPMRFGSSSMASPPTRSAAAWQEIVFNRSVQRVSIVDHGHPGGVHPFNREFLRQHVPHPADESTPLRPVLQRVQARWSASDVPCGALLPLSNPPSEYTHFLGMGPGRAGAHSSSAAMVPTVSRVPSAYIYQPLCRWSRSAGIEGELWRTLHDAGWVRHSETHATL